MKDKKEQTRKLFKFQLQFFFPEEDVWNINTEPIATAM